MMRSLQVAMVEVESVSEHHGYAYRVQDVLITMILGLFCGLKTIDEIRQWCSVPHVMDSLRREFSIKKLPCRAHFYNLLTYVNHNKFSVEFEKWLQRLMPKGMKDITISIDGKALRSTAHFTEDKRVISIASALIADTGLIIASKECKSKNSEDKAAGEVGAFREIIESLEIKC